MLSSEPVMCEINLLGLCAHIASNLGADSAGIAVIDCLGIRYVAGSGFDWRRVPALRVGESLLGSIVAHGSVLASDDIRTDPRCRTVSEARDAGVAAFMGCPLKHDDGSVFGVVAVHRGEPHEWRPDELTSLEGMASLLGSILTRSVRAGFGWRTGVESQIGVQPATVIVCCAPSTKKIFEKAARIAPSLYPVLITGERGTGKNVLATLIHEKSGRKGRLVALSCATLQDELLEAELFGHTRGAFTGAHRETEGLMAAARGGTLFLDEIAELSPRAQPKLLRAMDRKAVRKVGGDSEVPVDVRIIAATNRDLRSGDEVEFREQLYDRLSGFELHVKPLRERPEDLDALVATFVPKIAADLHHDVAGISDDAMGALRHYSWPGNIRELHKVLMEATFETPQGDWVPLEALPYHVRANTPGGLVGPRHGAHHRGPVQRPGRGAPASVVLACYEKHAGNTARVAEDLGVTQRAVQKRIKEIRRQA